MTPEMLLDVSADRGVAAISDRALAVMAKYGGGSKSSARKPKSSECVLVANTWAGGDAPLTEGELKAKELAMRKAEAKATINRYISGKHCNAVPAPEEVPRPSSSSRPSSSRVRSVAAARAAREALPMALGGLAMEAPDVTEPELELVYGSSRGEPDEPSLPSLPVLWEAWCDELEGEEARVFSVRVSQCGTLLAAGCGDGTVRVFHASNGRLSGVLDGLEAGSGDVRLPATCLRWRAGRALLVAHASGVLERWQAGSAPKRTHAVSEAGNEIYAIDCLAPRGQLATAGKDTAVRVYDEGRLEVVSTLGSSDPEMRRYEGSSGGAVGHTNRVFSLRFHPEVPSLPL